MKRYEHIDIAKGIGILLVVFFHLPNIDKLALFAYWGGWITTFYMPLFFALSGIFFKPTNIITRQRGLLIPYLSFYSIGFILETAKQIVKHKSANLEDFLLPFLGATHGYANTPVWFLLALAEMTLIGFILSRYLSKLHSFVLSIALGVLGYYLGCFHVFSSYYISVTLLCMPFFWGGLFFKDYLLKDTKNVIIGLGLILCSWLLFFPNTPICNVSQCYIPCSFIQFVAVSVSAIIGTLLLSQVIAKKTKYLKKALIFFGTNSLIVLCTHLFFINFPLLLRFFIPYDSLSLILGFILLMVVEIPLIRLINRKLKFLIGK